jgi:ABC-type transporter Mla maintaining outer membrane lipid asymmetry ATPase subunit MlaF
MTAASPSTETPVIELVDAAVSRQGAPGPALLEGISWRVARGDYWVVWGLHGAGKTDFVATAAGLQHPLRGRHFLFGKELTGLVEEEYMTERLKAGVVFENGGRLFSHLTVADNVALPLCYHRNLPPAEAREQVLGMLEWMELKRYANSTPGRVGQVWRQRAALARALALRPELLLLDNPISGMDPRQSRWWFDTLNQLSAGHPLLGGKPITLVVAAGDVQPWLEHGRQFALLHQRQWRPLGAREEFAGQAAALTEELLAAETRPG